MTAPASREETAGTTDPVVPDVPSAILGWRTWRVGRRAQQRHVLFAPLTGVPWPAGRPMVATCASPRHRPPGERCPCGLHALGDPAALGWGTSDHEVLGVVALWGEVVEGERGWRASHGYPRFLLTGPGVSAEQRAAIARRYGVPVHRCELPPRDLAAFLGSDRVAADELAHGTDAALTAHLADRVPTWARLRREEQARAEADRARRRARRRRREALGRAAVPAWLLVAQPTLLAALAVGVPAAGVLDAGAWASPWAGVAVLLVLAVLAAASVVAGVRRLRARPAVAVSRDGAGRGTPGAGRAAARR